MVIVFWHLQAASTLQFISQAHFWSAANLASAISLADYREIILKQAFMFFSIFQLALKIRGSGSAIFLLWLPPLTVISISLVFMKLSIIQWISAFITLPSEIFSVLLPLIDCLCSHLEIRTNILWTLCYLDIQRWAFILQHKCTDYLPWCVVYFNSYLFAMLHKESYSKLVNTSSCLMSWM